MTVRHLGSDVVFSRWDALKDEGYMSYSVISLTGVM